jgi:pimeloyl-ACP methyl ester carboxylesterase
MIPGIRLVIPADSLFGGFSALSIIELEKVQQKRDQELVTFRQLLVYGDVVPLSDSRFDSENANKGLWEPADFLMELLRPGVYFTEEYDPKRTPVLFVHGIGGSPREFEYLVDQMDRDSFQPWFFYYPSGLELEGLAAQLVATLTELRLRHRFDELVVVAHSMGGLVSRSFLLQQEAASPHRYIPLFVSISSPFGGMASAQSAENSPVMLPDSILDIATGSIFLANLFYLDSETRQHLRPLPEGVVHHMIFGFRRQSSRLGESSDKTVTVASQLRPEAQAQASSIFGIDADHTGILRAPETAAHLNGLLAETID